MGVDSTQQRTSRGHWEQPERSIIVAYTLALVLFVAIGIMAFIYFGRFGESSEWVRHTEQVLAKLSEGLGELKDTETGQRGYLLTGDEDFLEPYHRSVSAVRLRFDEIAKLTADNPSQQQRIQALRPLIDEKLEFSAQTIETFRRGGREKALVMVSSRRGKRIMDEIRRRVAEMEAEERTLLMRRLEHAERNAWLANVFILFGNGFAFALLAGGTFLLGREFNRRRALYEQLELQRAREELVEREREQRRRLEAILNEMPIGVLLLDAPGGDMTFCNARMRSLFGGAVPPCRADNRYADFGFLRADGTPYPHGELPLERALIREEIVCGEELQARRADGASIPLVASAAPIRGPEGGVIGVVSTFDDFTGAKRSEEERREAKRFRDLFMSMLGHDLRNPLSVITAGAAALSRRSLKPEEVKVVNRMAWSAERMARMIDQVLDMTQVRLGGGLTIEPKLADLGAIARRTTERLEVSYPERTIEVVTEGDLGGEWDPGRISQVLTYLLVNAFEHGRANAPVQLSVRESGAKVMAEVHNEGNPIPPDLVPLIFDPFQRAAERRRMKSAGLGLGLYLALQIVREHGGDIEVDSSAAAGTTLRVILPRTHELSESRADRG
jgi:signal transduction histidine kinase/CHASE3 domain sensor protein